MKCRIKSSLIDLEGLFIIFFYSRDFISECFGEGVMKRCIVVVLLLGLGLPSGLLGMRKGMKRSMPEGGSFDVEGFRRKGALLDLGSVRGPTLPEGLEGMSYEKRFRYGMLDVAKAHEFDASKDLISITPENSYIVWGTGENEGMVKVLTILTPWHLRFYLRDRAMVDALVEGLRASVKGEFLLEGNIPVSLNEENFKRLMNDLLGEWWGGNENYPNFRPQVPAPSYFNWVTVAPELITYLKNVVAGVGGDVSRLSFKVSPDEAFQGAQALSLKVDARLGIPPAGLEKDQTKVVVELWVKPDDLFRFTIDPEPFDSDGFPVMNDKKKGETFFRDITKKISWDCLKSPFISAEQERFIGKRRAPGGPFSWMNSADIDPRTGKKRLPWWIAQNKIRTTAPWTSLGYSYDLNADAFLKGNFVGCSEFGTKPGAVTRIAGIYSIDRYLDNFGKDQKVVLGQVKQKFKEVQDVVNYVGADVGEKGVAEKIESDPDQTLIRFLKSRRLRVAEMGRFQEIYKKWLKGEDVPRAILHEARIILGTGDFYLRASEKRAKDLIEACNKDRFLRNAHRQESKKKRLFLANQPELELEERSLTWEMAKAREAVEKAKKFVRKHLNFQATGFGEGFPIFNSFRLSKITSIDYLLTVEFFTDWIVKEIDKVKERIKSSLRSEALMQMTSVGVMGAKPSEEEVEKATAFAKAHLPYHLSDHICDKFVRGEAFVGPMNLLRKARSPEAFYRELLHPIMGYIKEKIDLQLGD